MGIFQFKGAAARFWLNRSEMFLACTMAGNFNTIVTGCILYGYLSLINDQKV
jgi:hypothetical protein